MYLSGYGNVAGAPGNMGALQLDEILKFYNNPEMLKNANQPIKSSSTQAIGNAGAIDPSSFGFQNKFVS